ncbi:MAG: Abi family protein [Firmicutes bacterium]|nr:Abi family protein [Bacillota bacterium]
MKPKLNLVEQVSYLKDKGIKFEKVSEEDAAHYLSHSNYYYKLTSYRKNFEKYTFGPNAGKYICLDFAHLIDLAILDSYLRILVLEMALNIEHYSKLKLLHTLENQDNEDGYSIIQDFISTEAGANILNSIQNKSTSIYSGDIISHFEEDQYPLWAFIEIISFGDYLRLLKFCADRWNSRDLINDFYLMKDVKALRNASAHNNCILNDLLSKVETRRPSYEISRELNEIGRSANQRHLRKTRIKQLITLFYSHKKIVTSSGVKENIYEKASEFSNRMFENFDYSFNESLKSSLNYLSRAIEILLKVS